MSVAPHSGQAAPTTPPTAAATSSGTGWPKLARGEIPSTWSKPAEVVTTTTPRAKGAFPIGPLVGVGVAIGTAALVFVAMPNLRGATTNTSANANANANANGIVNNANANANALVANDPQNAIVVASTANSAVSATDTNATNAINATNATNATNTIARVDVAEAIPTPPPTSSTTAESAVAPEDQGGDANADAATAGDVVTELPARKKAKGLTARAIAALRGGDIAGAEPMLVRAVLVDPSLADAWRHLGIARAQLGDVEGARRAYRKYLELAPKAPDAAQVRAILAAP